MKPYILLFLAVLLVGCGSKTNKTSSANTADAEKSEAVMFMDVSSFCADLDFDGEQELITGYTKDADTPRGVGRYTRIYKIVDGVPHDATEYFKSKSPIFEEIDEYYFKINRKRNEIIYYESDGIYCAGWQVGRFTNLRTEITYTTGIFNTW